LYGINLKNIGTSAGFDLSGWMVFLSLKIQTGVNMMKKKDKERLETPKQTVREFKVGDLAVYPAHGVGRINSIETRIVNGEEHDFYMMKIIENEMTIMIPTWNVDQVGLRDVIDIKEIPKVYEIMKKREDSTTETQTWNRRYREYMDKIKTGSLYDVAEVYRDLSLLKLTKDLSFGERKLYDTAQTLLIMELSTARNTDEETIMAEMEILFPPKKPESTENLDISDK
jgi:CarD family transcriptional regulator